MQTPLQRRIVFSAFGVAAALLAACGGGGGGPKSTLPATASGTPTTTQPAQTSSATAQMSVLVPNAAAIAAIARRSPKYISPSTKSMTIGLVSGSATTALGEIDLTSSSPNCTTVQAGTQCTASISAPAGADQFAVTMYDQTGGKGNALSSATISATLSATAATTIPVAVDGIAANVNVIPAAASLPVGTAGTVLVDVQAYDASSNIIVGPSAFANPVTLTIAGDPYSTLALSSAQVTTPNQHITLAYTGGSLVGATITPSGTNITGAAAKFAGSGVKVNVFTPISSYQSGSSVSTSTLYPVDVAAFSNGTAALLFERSACTTNTCYGNPIAMANPTGVTSQFFVGDTSDPYGVPIALPTPDGQVTIVHGMSTSLQTDPGEAYTTLAAGPNNTVFYIADFTSNNYPGCTGTAGSGLIGHLNPATGTTTETVLKGYPYQIRSDATGNVFFTEYAGSCNGGTSLLDGTSTFQYAVGEITAGGAVTETQLSTLGISPGVNIYPADMAMATDDSAMYIADDNNRQIIKIPSSGGTFSHATAVSLAAAYYPYTIATGTDGSVAWWTDYDSSNQYYWGYFGAGATFGPGALNELPFGVTPYFYSYSMAYADGSYFVAGNEYGTGMARIGLQATGAPVQAFIPDAYNDYGEQEMTGIAAAGGYVWAGDYEYGLLTVMQYGALTAGTITPQSSARAASLATSVRRTSTVHASWNHVHMKPAAAGKAIAI